MYIFVNSILIEFGKLLLLFMNIEINIQVKKELIAELMGLRWVKFRS